MTKTATRWILAACLALLLVPATDAQQAIRPGYDYWQTLGSGATRYNFAENPIPAGFLCAGSEPFTGHIFFEGVPLQTDPPGALGTTDTIIQRMDRAVFNRDGVATSRLRAVALNLIGTTPIQTPCGTWNASATLAPNQPISTITFQRQHHMGGVFQADLRLNVLITFTHAETGEERSVTHEVYLPTINDSPFAFTSALTSTTTERTACTVNEEPVPTTNTSGLLAGPVTVLDGVERPLRLGRFLQSAGDHLAASTTETTETGTTSDTDTGTVTGCMCNPDTGECLPVYDWHDPCPSYPFPEGCEIHFTHEPCELPMYQYLPQCQNPEVLSSYRTQLDELAERGYILDDPDVVLQKQMRNMRRGLELQMQQ